MTKEQLERGIELQNKILNCNRDIDKWEKILSTNKDIFCNEMQFPLTRFAIREQIQSIKSYIKTFENQFDNL